MELLKIVSQSISSQFHDSLRQKNVIAAVSGGCDSIVMVHVLRELQSEFGYMLTAVTVDHNMRSDGSSREDADFTRSFCSNIGVPCTVVEIPAGKLVETEKERNGGLEEAARFLRYGIFATKADELSAEAVFLAHNQNDQLETVLERFLQGSDSSGIKGIARYRKPYFRPLLSVSRSDIEQYALSYNLMWRTDPTNNDTAYYRNRIRHILIPLLNEQFSGWDTAVLKGAEKAALETTAFEALSAVCPWTNATTNIASANLPSFLSQPLAVRIRILYNGLRLFSVKGRIPYATVAAFAETQKTVTACGIRFSVDSDTLTLSLESELRSAVDGFCCLVTEEGEYQIPAGKIRVEKQTDVFYRARHEESGVVSGLFQLPAVFRNGTSLDAIRTKNNTSKGVLKILAEWKVPQNIKSQIPVIEDTEVRGIWGAPAGFDDWFVLQGVNR